MKALHVGVMLLLLVALIDCRAIKKGHKGKKKEVTPDTSSEDQSKRHVQSYNDPLAEQNPDEDEAHPMPQPGHVPQNLNGIIQKYKPKKVQDDKKNKNKNKQDNKQSYAAGTSDSENSEEAPDEAEAPPPGGAPPAGGNPPPPGGAQPPPAGGQPTTTPAPPPAGDDDDSDDSDDDAQPPEQKPAPGGGSPPPPGGAPPPPGGAPPPPGGAPPPPGGVPPPPGGAPPPPAGKKPPTEAKSDGDDQEDLKALLDESIGNLVKANQAVETLLSASSGGLPLPPLSPFPCSTCTIICLPGCDTTCCHGGNKKNKTFNAKLHHRKKTRHHDRKSHKGYISDDDKRHNDNNNMVAPTMPSLPLSRFVVAPTMPAPPTVCCDKDHPVILNCDIPPCQPTNCIYCYNPGSPVVGNSLIIPNAG
uniref:Uncharacterized protein n=1 Tax=Clytia hemisphaerica TaxID=252671 RepID=A0A7M5XBW8_9CNID